jgi:hypothetical protein
VHGEGTHTVEDCRSQEFVAGGIIVKLPPSSRDFATTLKHKKVHMSISDLITSLNVE